MLGAMNQRSVRIDSLLRAPRVLLAEVSALPRWSRLLAAVFLVAAWALAFPRGGPGAILVASLCIALVTIIAWVIADAADRRWVLLWVLLAITAREMLVGAVDVALLSRGNIWYAPDEHVYIDHARAIWQHWVDPAAPFDADPYTTSWYVHAMARSYLIFGQDLVVVKLVNTALAVVTCLFGYRAMRNLGLPGARYALVLLLAFPSVAFWSALTLKDAYVIFFLIGSLWAASEFVRSRNWLWLTVAVLAVYPLETVRLYMLATGALALLAVPFALTRWRERLGVGLALVASVYVMFAIVQPFKDLGSNVFYIPIFLRGAVAQGARSSFVDPRPVIEGVPGERFQIQVVAGTTPAPAATPRVIRVEPGTAIVVENAARTTPVPVAGRPTAAVVRPGDIVLIATPVPSAGASGAPENTTAPRIVTIEPEAKNTVGLSSDLDPDLGSFGGSLATNVRHLPVGIAYTLFAPFPWTARTLEQIATIPEMVIWYPCLLLALVGFLTLLRRGDLRYAHGVAAIIGLTIVLSLISANVGTLIRSRAMLIPYVLLLTGVGIDWLLVRYPQLFNRLRSRA